MGSMSGLALEATINTLSSFKTTIENEHFKEFQRQKQAQ